MTVCFVSCVTTKRTSFLSINRINNSHSFLYCKERIKFVEQQTRFLRGWKFFTELSSKIFFFINRRICICFRLSVEMQPNKTIYPLLVIKGNRNERKVLFRCDGSLETEAHQSYPPQTIQFYVRICSSVLKKVWLSNAHLCYLSMLKI